MDNRTLGVTIAKSLSRGAESVTLPRETVLALVAKDGDLKAKVDSAMDTFAVLNAVPRTRKERSDKGKTKDSKTDSKGKGKA